MDQLMLIPLPAHLAGLPCLCGFSTSSHPWLLRVKTSQQPSARDPIVVWQGSLCAAPGGARAASGLLLAPQFLLLCSEGSSRTKPHMLPRDAVGASSTHCFPCCLSVFQMYLFLLLLWSLQKPCCIF